MKPLFRAAITAAFFLPVGLLVGSGLAEARQCAALAVWEKALVEQFGERQTAVAEADGKSKGQTFAMIWYESPAGTWTQLVVSRQGLACHIASGKGGIRRVSRVRQPVGTPAPIAPLPPPQLSDEEKRFIRQVIEGRDV